MAAYSEFLAMLAQLPPNVMRASFDPSTGAFTVDLAPGGAVPAKPGEQERLVRRLRDTDGIANTGPVVHDTEG